MAEKKNETHELLLEVMRRLDRIEELLAGKPSTIKPDSWSESDVSDRPASPKVEEDDGYETDGDEFIVEESYDSENEFPRERPEALAAPKLSLNPLQIQLANEEFEYYKAMGMAASAALSPQRHTDRSADTQSWE